MNLVFYVHDLFIEIGHSNVTIDMINNLPNKEQNTYKFVVYSHGNIKELFPDIYHRISIHKLPFNNLKPTFLKIVFYQFYTFLYSLIFDRGSTRISLGVSNFFANVCIVHFIHSQWSTIYFNLFKMNPLRFLYKKLMYTHLFISELIMFRLIKPETILVSEFMEKYLVDHLNFPLNKLRTIHSGFNVERFNDPIPKEVAFERLLKLETLSFQLNFKKPICLFVGAFERKGFPLLLKKWREKDRDTQLIIVGNSESNKEESIEFGPNIFHVKKTGNINLYYDLADYFLFPTIYEPFGMVLIEAAIKGLEIYTTSKNVGAVELLGDLPGIHVFESSDTFKIPSNYQVLTIEGKLDRASERKKKLLSYNWSEVSKKYQEVFNGLKHS